MSFRKNTSVLFLAVVLTACTAANATQQVVFPTYDPFLPIQGTSGVSVTDSLIANQTTSTVSPDFTATPRPPTPTLVPLNISPLTGIQDQLANTTPTPDPARLLPTPRKDTEDYIVQPGDSLGAIAERYGVSLQSLMNANNITDPNLLEVGMVLVIPAQNPINIETTQLKIIPDSELVYSPSTAHFNVAKFVASQNGYLNHYTQDVNGLLLNGADIVWAVSVNYSVNPRILLAILEYRSGWVTNPQPTNIDYPMGFYDQNRAGLYRQMTWAANMLNRGYYLWRANALSNYVLTDGQVIQVDPTINAGTAGVQYFFSQTDDLAAWEKDVSETGLILSYYVFFGNPFSFAIEPLVPAGLTQPMMSLPYPVGESWYFTGGPHGAWDSGSAWGALDFAPPDNTDGNCLISSHWVTAMADGYIARTGKGSVIQDLDGDGYEQTGWVIVYMHVAEEGRVQQGEYAFADERIGHPSCEGGVSNATHVHITRKYNGEWIAADGQMPFNMDGWISTGDGYEYDGFLTRGSQSIEALDSANGLNLVPR